MRLASEDEVARCQSVLDALHLCLALDPVRGRPNGYYADHLNRDRSHWSRMLSGRAAIDASVIEPLQLICRNTAINQHLNRRFALDTIPHQESEIEQLRRENAALRKEGVR